MKFDPWCAIICLDDKLYQKNKNNAPQVKKMQFTHMTNKEYRALLQKPEHKFHNQITINHGIQFDSKKEALRWDELQHLQRIGVIKNLQRQVPYELQPPYTTRDGRKIRKIEYIADFVYEQGGETIVEDAKGVQTDVFKIKRKMFEYKYPDLIFKLS